MSCHFPCLFVFFCLVFYQVLSFPSVFLHCSIWNSDVFCQQSVVLVLIGPISPVLVSRVVFVLRLLNRASFAFAFHLMLVPSVCRSCHVVQVVEFLFVIPAQRRWVVLLALGVTLFVLCFGCVCRRTCVFMHLRSCGPYRLFHMLQFHGFICGRHVLLSCIMLICSFGTPLRAILFLLCLCTASIWLCCFSGFVSGQW